METESVDKNAGTELLEVTDKDLTSLVQDEENNEPIATNGLNDMSKSNNDNTSQKDVSYRGIFINGL